MRRLNAQANSAKHSAFMRNTGYTNTGAIKSPTAMTTKAMSSLRSRARWPGRSIGSATSSMSGAPAEQARGPDEQNDRHDDEDHGVRRLGEEHLGQPLNDAERK